MCRHRHFKNLRGPKRILAIIGMAIGGVIIAAGMALLFGLVVLWLWNWLMPELFGLPVITFWQAWGLVVLSHILFKSFPHNGHHDKYHEEHWKSKFKEKLMEKEEENNPEPEAA